MINGMIDLRSDTVTVPTPEMRQAMFDAIVGDDVYQDDVTVNELEALGAEMFGKEAALFVPTGTMSNQLALFVHANRCQEVILPEECHIIAHEGGAGAMIAGVQFRTVEPNAAGEMPMATIERYIRKNIEDIHVPSTALITYENADSQGRVHSIEYMKSIKTLANKYNLPVHLDGARIFNGATVLGVDVKEMVQHVDTISVCLSKGLCAPVGSLLIGSKEFIYEARRKRKILGGGMRQVGILAAAGKIALEVMSKRLGEDHENAKYLAKRLEEVKGIQVYKDSVHMTMVFFSGEEYPLTSDELLTYMKENKVIMSEAENNVYRFVVHYYVSKEEIDRVVELLKAKQ